MQDTLPLSQNGTDDKTTNGDILLKKSGPLFFADILIDVQALNWDDAILSFGEEREFELRDAGSFQAPDRKAWFKEANIVKVTTQTYKNGAGAINGVSISDLKQIFDDIEWGESRYPRIQIFYHPGSKAFVINKKPE